MRCPLRMSMRPNLLLLVGTFTLTTLNNPTLRILASPHSSNPSPRLLTHNKTPRNRKQKTKAATQCTPPKNGTAPTIPHTKSAAPKGAAHKL